MAATVTGNVKAPIAQVSTIIVEFTLISLAPVIASAAVVAYGDVTKTITTDGSGNGSFSQVLPAGIWHVRMNSVEQWDIRVPDDNGTYDWNSILLVNAPTSPPSITNAVLIAQANGAPDSGSVEFISSTYDADGCITTAVVKWPVDGSAGVYTMTAKDALWLKWNAWTITHANSGKTVTQPLVTRRSQDGQIQSPKPALVVS